jgi:DNA polymerase-1
MVRIDEKMKKDKYLSKMILQVHDELIFEVQTNELEKLKKMVLYEMSNAVKLVVPLKVDCGTGNNWFEAH